ncbi:hypothetical protein WKS98_08515 [Lagierella sp. ICN-221743]
MIEFKEFAEAVKNVTYKNIRYGSDEKFWIFRDSEDLEIVEEYLLHDFTELSDEMLIGYIFGLNQMVEIQEKLKGVTK